MSAREQAERIGAQGSAVFLRFGSGECLAGMAESVEHRVVGDVLEVADEQRPGRSGVEGCCRGGREGAEEQGSERGLRDVR